MVFVAVKIAASVHEYIYARYIEFYAYNLDL